jgi:hypothetical protein
VNLAGLALVVRFGAVIIATQEHVITWLVNVTKAVKMATPDINVTQVSLFVPHKC